jgi:hypothetical protein
MLLVWCVLLLALDETTLFVGLLGLIFDFYPRLHIYSDYILTILWIGFGLIFLSWNFCFLSFWDEVFLIVMGFQSLG